MSSAIHPKVPLVLAVDVGTTAMKGGLINGDGELVSYHRVTYWEKTKQDYHSWNPQVWVDSLRDIVASLGGYQQIIAVVISGHGPSLVPVDQQGKTSSRPSCGWIRGRTASAEPYVLFPPKNRLV
jgi:sugar (pentulose or hexulose) kinase